MGASVSMQSKYFHPTGGVVVASCYNKECDLMRRLAKKFGHGVCVAYEPSVFDFTDEYREALDHLAKYAGTVLVITGDDGSKGKTQIFEMDEMDKMGIKYRIVTIKQYEDEFGADDQLAMLAADANYHTIVLINDCFNTSCNIYADNNKDLIGHIDEGGAWSSPNDWYDSSPDGGAGCTVWIEPKGAESARFKMTGLYRTGNPHSIKAYAREAN